MVSWQVAIIVFSSAIDKAQQKENAPKNTCAHPRGQFTTWADVEIGALETAQASDHWFVQHVSLRMSHFYSRLGISEY